MTGGLRRRRIPLALQDLASWPSPDISTRTREEQEEFHRKRQAVEMYAIGTGFAAIKKATGVCKTELYRVVGRCLTWAGNGTIYGFAALLGRVRVKGYSRKQKVSHQPGSGPGGCSGALTQLLERYPKIDDLLLDKFYNRQKGVMPESRTQIRTIHEAFVKALRKLGLTNNDWPFNTANCGYKSVHAYLKAIRANDAQGTAEPRAGVEAARRGAVGTGILSIFPCLRPYAAMQLDFHKVDAAAVFVLKNDFGEEFEIPVSRWHFGLMIEESMHAVVGFSVVLDLNPSGDDALEVVSSALSNRDLEGADIDGTQTKHGAVFVNQLIPELEYQGFSILKVDRAWANAAHEVVNNIIDVVGCAVNFGPVRSWWCRNLVEKVFGELTRRGLQRLPSTHGKGPGDTRINKPNEQAVKFRIRIRDLIAIFLKAIREHNLRDSEGLQWTSPVNGLRNALANPASGFFLQPLPNAAQAQRQLMMHVQEVTVLGNIDKNVRPYFNLDRHKHTNETLADRFSLIGKTLIVYVDRRLARRVYAAVKETGERLGMMNLSGPWARSDCNWRFRKLMNQAGMSKRLRATTDDPMEQVKQEKMEKLKKTRKSGRGKSSRTALEVAKMDQQRAKVAGHGGRNTQAAPSTKSPSVAMPSPAKRDPFGIGTIPNID